MRYRLVPIGVAVVAAGLAVAATTSYKLVLNGKAAGQAIVVNGQTYLPLNALKAAGVKATVSGSTLTVTLPGAPASPAAQTTPAGGANQVTAIEGCVGETLFNGVWRFKVNKLTLVHRGDVDNPPGWQVDFEFRNGTKTTTSFMNTGSEGLSSPQMVLPDGTTLKLEENDYLKVWSKDVIQGGVATGSLRFFFPAGTPDAQAVKPSKFILLLNQPIPSYYPIKYSIPDPSFRVRLDCQK